MVSLVLKPTCFCSGPDVLSTSSCQEGRQGRGGGIVRQAKSNPSTARRRTACAEDVGVLLGGMRETWRSADSRGGDGSIFKEHPQLCNSVEKGGRERERERELQMGGVLSGEFVRAHVCIGAQYSRRARARRHVRSLAACRHDHGGSLFSERVPRSCFSVVCESSQV